MPALGLRMLGRSSGGLVSRLGNGFLGLAMACYGGLHWILSGLSKSTDHRARAMAMTISVPEQDRKSLPQYYCVHKGHRPCYEGLAVL